MCMDKVVESGLNKSGFGYKVFTCEDGRFYGEYYSNNLANDRIPVEIDEWIEAIEIDITGADYPSGFHIFLDQERAERWHKSSYQNVVKVKYKSGHTLGLFCGEEGDADTIVAKYMKILP